MKKILLIFLYLPSFIFAKYISPDGFIRLTQEEIQESRNNPNIFTCIKEVEKKENEVNMIFGGTNNFYRKLMHVPIDEFSKLQLRKNTEFGFIAEMIYKIVKKTKDIWMIKSFSKDLLQLLKYDGELHDGILVQYWDLKTIDTGIAEIVFTRDSGEKIRIEIEIC